MSEEQPRRKNTRHTETFKREVITLRYQNALVLPKPLVNWV